ncbi:hypothetical protein PINS_up014740 [Pythium insidiosum]|nr:hypothetical protein PINS_up014740 [Pythium insidiosum]
MSGGDDGDADADEDDDTEHEAESIAGEMFDSWDVFDSFVAAYCKRTFEVRVSSGARSRKSYCGN